ncbi:CopD family protein [Deinococcus aquaticus]|uniref:CopD family protein n=1 Tax=Deinococcus aquaticus TaxID=328692 RepID=A0ABY7V6A7_9DEIO|nr:CopD family protein [Deinococcus aquaticus]WDA60260.1 CopD family protein [Deinococcus aquaticus]
MTILAAALTYLGLTLLLGGALTRHVLTPGTPRLRVLTAGFALMLLGWGAQVALTFSALGIGLIGAAAPADLLAFMTGTGVGRAMLLGAVGGALLLALELSAPDLRRVPGAGPCLLLPCLLLAAALLTLWGVAGVGHGAGHGPLIRALHLLHGAAMVTWVGGVLALTLVRPLTPAHAARFTPLAAGSVGVLAVTGVLLAGQHLATPQQWLGSPYGQVLLVKLMLVALALGAAGLVRRAVARRAAVRTLIARELLLLLAVLGVTGALTGQSPPHGHGDAARHAPARP